MSSNFCPACRNLLVIQTSTGNVIRFCNRCLVSFEGKDDNTQIYFTFDSKNVSCNKQHILQLAPFDRINEVVKKECPKCQKRKYMTRVVLDNEVFFCCDNEECMNQLKGSNEE